MPGLVVSGRSGSLNMNLFVVCQNLRRMRYGRIYNGVVGVHERTEEVLAVADFGRSSLVRNSDCTDSGFRSCAFHLHVVLSPVPLKGWR